MSASAELVPVDPARVAEFLPHVERFLKSASHETGASDWESDKQQIQSGVALLWLAWDGKRIMGAGTTEIATMNGARHCYVTAFGGDGREKWLHLISTVESYAKRHGCKSVRILGRRGWVRVLPAYKPSLVLLEKELA